MKILRLITRMNVGGPARQVSYLHAEMTRRGHDHVLMYGQLDAGEGDMSYLLGDDVEVLKGEGLKGKTSGARLFQLEDLKRPIALWNDTKTLFQLWVYLWREPVELLHTHTAKAGLLGRLAQVLAAPFRAVRGFPRVKVVHTYHGHVFDGYFSAAMTRVVLTLEKFLWRQSDVLLTLTPVLREQILDHLSWGGSWQKDKMRVVPLGLPLAPFLELKRRPVFHLNSGPLNSKLPDSEPLSREHLSSGPLDSGPQPKYWIGWVGRLAPIKNPQRFLRWAEALMGTLPDGEKAKALFENKESPSSTSISREDLGFVMVGDGVLRSEVEAQVKDSKHLRGRVLFMGWQSDLGAVYEGLDVVLNTSDNEGTPVAVLEALASGCPVLATDVGGTAEVLPLAQGEPCLCMPIGEFETQYDEACVSQPQSFEAGFKEVLAWLSGGERISQACRESVVEQFSQERLVEDLESIYEALLKD